MVTGLCSVVNELKKDLLVRSKHQDALILQCDAAVKAVDGRVAAFGEALSSRAMRSPPRRAELEAQPPSAAAEPQSPAPPLLPSPTADPQSPLVQQQPAAAEEADATAAAAAAATAASASAAAAAAAAAGGAKAKAKAAALQLSISERLAALKARKKQQPPQPVATSTSTSTSTSTTDAPPDAAAAARPTKRARVYEIDLADTSTIYSGSVRAGAREGAGGRAATGPAGRRKGTGAGGGGGTTRTWPTFPRCRRRPFPQPQRPRVPPRTRGSCSTGGWQEGRRGGRGGGRSSSSSLGPT